jgi:aryl-alcohol dehydrogenase-like predicted oxidoreductase
MRLIAAVHRREQPGQGSRNVMEKRKLGKSNLEVSVVGIGCNNFGLRADAAQTRAVVDKAIDLGVTLFDTADRYGQPFGSSERYLGQALGARRKNIVLASKFGNPMDDSGTMQGASRRYIKIAVEESLKRLGTDWIDLYQLHAPDTKTPIEETLRALEDLVREGKIRHAGCSQFSAEQIREASRTAKQAGIEGLVSGQNHYNLIKRDMEREFVPAMLECGVSFIPFYPLAGGLLTGKYRRDAAPEGSRFATPREQEKRALAGNPWPALEKLEAFCAARGRSMLDLAVNWLLTRPGVATMIAGATRPSQVESNVKAAGSWKLTAGDLAELDRITAAAS